MKGRKITAILLSITFAGSLSISVGANYDYLRSNMSFLDLKQFTNNNTYDYKIFKYEKDNSAIDLSSAQSELLYYKNLLTYLEPTSDYYYEYSMNVAELNMNIALLSMEKNYYENRKSDDDKKLYDLNLNQKYYEYCILNKKFAIQKAKQKYVEKTAEVESVKFDNGLITENDKSIALINIDIARTETENAKNSLEQKRREIINYMNQYGFSDSFSMVCEFPEQIYYKKYDSRDLYNKFIENNYALEKAKKNLELQQNYISDISTIYGISQDTINEYRNNLEIDKLNYEKLCNEYKYQIDNVILQYENSFSQYQTYKKYSSVIDSKLNILFISKENDTVSEADYLKQCYELSEEKLHYYDFLVKTDILNQQLCLIEQGIWWDND